MTICRTSCVVKIQDGDIIFSGRTSLSNSSADTNLSRIASSLSVVPFA